MRLPLLALALVAPGGTLTLQNAAGKTERFPLDGRVTVVTFVSTLCPISNDFNDRMSALYRDYSGRVQLLFVNSNSNESAQSVEEHSRAAEYPFAVYKDIGNTVADRLGATLTPQAVVLDGEGRVQYRGHIEDSRNPARTRVRGLRNAIDLLLAGKPVAVKETKAFGCTIKRVRKDS